MERVVELTALTVGQFRTGDSYEGGVIKEVGPVEMVVEYPENSEESSASLIRRVATKLGFETNVKD